MLLGTTYIRSQKDNVFIKKEHILEKNTFASAVFQKAEHYTSSPTHLHIFSILVRILLLCTWPAFLHVKKTSY